MKKRTGIRRSKRGSQSRQQDRYRERPEHRGVYSKAAEKELEEIFIRTYGKVERKGGLTPKTYESEYAKNSAKKKRLCRNTCWLTDTMLFLHGKS